jgi:hypothetical protein
MNSPHNSLKIPLGKDAHRMAKKFADQAMEPLPKLEKPATGLRVYLNTLAVYAVNSYLTLLAYKIEREGSETWNSYGVRLPLDVAALKLTGIGLLECCPLREGEDMFAIPSAATEGRIAYLPVQIAQRLDHAKLLGFAPGIEILPDTEFFFIDDVQDLDDLIDYLYRIESGTALFEEESDTPLVIEFLQKISLELVPEIISQAERIYREESREQHPELIQELLKGKIVEAGGDREPGQQPEDDSKSLDLATSLLEKLRELWEE